MTDTTLQQQLVELKLKYEQMERANEKIQQMYDELLIQYKMQHSILKERHELDKFFRKVDSFVQWTHSCIKLFLYVSIFLCIVCIVGMNYDSYSLLGNQYYSMMYDKQYIIKHVPYSKYIIICIEEIYIMMKNIMIALCHLFGYFEIAHEPMPHTNQPNTYRQDNTSTESEPDGLLDMFLISLYGLL